MCSLLIQAATLFLTLATASVLCAASSAPSTIPKDITTVAGTTGPDHLSIFFSAPCSGCFEDPDDGLELTLDIDSAEEECSTTAPRLNGLPLVASNYGNGVASGQVFLQSKSTRGSSVRNVHASWESTCLKGEASIVSVRLEGVVGQDALNDPSGFTTSFKQKGQPQVLRLQDKPVDRLSQDLCEAWLLSDGLTPSITPVLPEPQSTVDILLQAEYAQLAQLQADMELLHEQLHSTLKNIMSLLKQKFTACSSMQCVWNTAVSEVSPIANLVVAHFKHHKNLVSGCREGDAQSPCSAAIEDKTPEDGSMTEIENVAGDRDGAHITPAASTSTTQPSTSPHPTSRGLSSPVSTYVQAFSASSLATPAVATSSAAYHHGFPHTRPHDEQVALQRKLGLAIILIVLLVILSGLVIRAIIKFRDPRRRAERAARWEERRTKRLYRKAACKHKWRTFWKNLCARKPGTEEYEEKRATLLEQDALLEDDDSGLQKEVRTMQNATEFVRDLVQAEEGRARNVQSSNHYTDGLEPVVLGGDVGSSRSSDIAPSYKTDATPPPGYEEELDGEMMVFDGFRYTYTPSITDDTPESSIVDCSPRLSLETGRSTILTKDTQD
ncbi:hypothetical protein PV04_10555 [Phialophora macrospora]|uniref:Mid2 domain-containing protein n=1 Tax=Phialophora macrospora TaxID=1851006 RepID=A0A0D2F5X9_9EURO|nr:hypothetical protein PV04_10555 [Phialophora macrospora]